MNPTPIDQDELPEAVVDQRRRLSLVWLIPLVAALAAGWLGYHSYRDRGPLVTIAFQSAEGLEAGKTRVRFKDVDIGTVERITLAPDLSFVRVQVRIMPGLSGSLNARSRFWVARPRLSGASVSGLGTLLGGIYIAADLVPEGVPRRVFEGLEEPPVIDSTQPGRMFVLAAESLDRLQVGSPVTLRGIEVGQIVDYSLADESGVEVRVFVRAPYHDQVGINTRFWVNPAFALSIQDSGLELNTGSLSTLLLGSIAMDAPDGAGGGRPVADEHRFLLHLDRARAFTQRSLQRDVWKVGFAGSVRGLEPGAAVELRGIHVGEVLDVQLQLDADNAAAEIPVHIAIDPARLGVALDQGREAVADALRSLLGDLVANGLRAQLKTANLLTGVKFVDLDFYPDAPSRELAWSDGVPVVPAVLTPLDELGVLVSKLARLPLDSMGKDLAASLAELRATTQATNALLGRLDRETASELTATLQQTRATLASMNRFLKPNSALQVEAQNTLREFSAAARSLRLMADFLERHPDALIRGKAGVQ